MDQVAVNRTDRVKWLTKSMRITECEGALSTVPSTSRSMETQRTNRMILRSDAQILEPSALGQNTNGEEYFFLASQGDMVTVTPLMKEVLEQLRTPHTPKELATWLSIKHHCEYDALFPTVNSFIDRMKKFGAVVEDGAQQGLASAIFEQLEQDKRFDDFVLGDRIGRNNSAAIYKCWKRESPEHLFSIKILVRGDSKESFFREAELLQTMPRHPNVRQCFEASVSTNGTPYLLLEYVEGKSISDPAIKRELPLSAKYQIGAELMSGMHHLHAHGILHGDIHASNFLVDADQHVHLIDLGMSYSENDKHVRHGGIPRYMSPERMSDHSYSFSRRKGDYASEIFQIGICLYLLLSGKYPFEGLLLKDLANAIKNYSPNPLTETFLSERIPSSIAKIVFKALEKTPSMRYKTVQEMLYDWTSATNNIGNGHAVLEPIFAH